MKVAKDGSREEPSRVTGESTGPFQQTVDVLPLIQEASSALRNHEGIVGHWRSFSDEKRM